jgi:hypothetical protein
MKSISSIHRPGERHWVGDGFPVNTVFSYHDRPTELSPFLLLDHAGPARFEPTGTERGVAWHPHRGFETVTIVLQGEVDHEDTAGNRGSVGPGDVQWMTAGSGLLHKEMHGRAYARQGGPFEMLQLWVNLPARLKMSQPKYQTLLASQIPLVDLPGGAGSVRVIAGEFAHAAIVAKGPASTFTPVNLFDVQLRAGHELRLTLGEGQTAALLVLKGAITVNDKEPALEGELAVFQRAGNEAVIAATADARVFVMNGAPIDEPVVGYGPFVMNTRQEIEQAIADLRAGRMGQIPELSE